MSKTSIATVAPGRLRAARRELLETGELRLNLPDAGLSRSWLRSHAAGLSPVGRTPGAPHASSAQLMRALEQQHELVAHARPVMQDLFAQTRESDGMVILSDGQGLLLQALGDGRFVDRAQRVALRPGAIWDERWRGTNAIGTALVERRPVAVMGGEHYLERNGFLSCTAAPIRDPQGRVLGVLDISGDQRSFHRHTLALVRMAARSVEHRLFQTRHAEALRLQLHPQREGLGTAGEGLLAVSEEGWIIGGNETALGWLGAEASRSLRLEAVLPIPWPQLLTWACMDDAAPQCVRREGDATALWVRASVPAAWRRTWVGVERLALSERNDGGATIGHAHPDRAAGAAAPIAVDWNAPDGGRGAPAMPAPNAPNAASAANAANAEKVGSVGKVADVANVANVANVAGTAALAPSAGGLLPSRWAQSPLPGVPSATARAPLQMPEHSPDAEWPAPLAALDLGDPAVHHLLRRLHKVLNKPIALLLQGESGVGKDVLARAVHDSGLRCKGPYVAVNCAALPEGLIEAELFGYRGGAFTGASREGAAGRLRQAHGGTLFLDEIGDMPLPLQARLLRVLQDRQVQPLGGGAAVSVDVQLICASHRPLRAMVEEGRFREDLYYRINGLALTVPPLRARSDLTTLVQRLLGRILAAQPQPGPQTQAQAQAQPLPLPLPLPPLHPLHPLHPHRPSAAGNGDSGVEVSVAPSVMTLMQRYAWPGNIRQLEQALRVAVAMLEPWEREIQVEHLPEDLQAELTAGGMAADQMAAGPMATGDVQVGELTADQAAAGEVSAAHVRAADVNAAHVKVAHVNVAHVKVANVNAADVNAGEPEASEVPATNDSPAHARASSDAGSTPPSAALRGHAKAHARQVLTACHGNVSEAARRLGIGRNTLYRLLR